LPYFQQNDQEVLEHIFFNILVSSMVLTRLTLTKALFIKLTFISGDLGRILGILRGIWSKVHLGY